jgi:hypothetical protein
MRKNSSWMALAFALALVGGASAQAPGAGPQGAGPQGRGGRPPGPVEVHAEPAGPGIAWFGTWDAALAEAKRTQRPILFMSAAPQCQRVPGVW